MGDNNQLNLNITVYEETDSSIEKVSKDISGTYDKYSDEGYINISFDALYKYSGTRYSLETSLESQSVVTGKATVFEWFEYKPTKGNPYYFKVNVENVINTSDAWKRIAKAINKYKNVRSWLEAITITRVSESNFNFAGVSDLGKDYSINIRYKPEIDTFNVYFGSVNILTKNITIGEF